MTRTELLATLARRLNKNTTLDSATSARLLDYLNEVNRQVLSIPGSERLRKATVTISATADRANYTVYDCSRILRVVDRTNQRVLPEMALGTYRDVAPDPAEWTGTPTHFVNTGPRATAMDPSDASTLLVKSDSAADTTQTAYIEGVVSGFTPARTSTTLTGTTAAAFGGTWVRVDAFYLSAAGAGNITLHEDTGGGTQLSSIRRVRHQHGVCRGHALPDPQRQPDLVCGHPAEHWPVQPDHIRVGHPARVPRPADLRRDGAGV
jgi:hypothetical protein